MKITLFWIFAFFLFVLPFALGAENVNIGPEATATCAYDINGPTYVCTKANDDNSLSSFQSGESTTAHHIALLWSAPKYVIFAQWKVPNYCVW